MNQGESNVKIGHVISIDDNADGLRVKAKLEQDKEISNIPWATPLLPKMFQCVPKEGEAVLILTSMSANKESQRYYIGPVISQQQYNEYAPYDYGKGKAVSLIQGGFISPDERISNYGITEGAFPNKNDVAILGRGGEDIILKENENTGSEEIDLRCGIRVEPVTKTEALKGKVVFNTEDPAYIQLKRKKGLMENKKQHTNSFDEQEGSSVVNVVADKINIISHKDDEKHKITDNKTLIDELELSDIMEKLHEVPYGDLLVKFLKTFVFAFITHTHPIGGTPPTQSASFSKLMDEYANIDDIISPNVRIS
jgi:hypothetical protein